MIYDPTPVCVSTQVLYVVSQHKSVSQHFAGLYLVSQHRAVSSVSAYCRSIPGVSAWICIWCCNIAKRCYDSNKASSCMDMSYLISVSCACAQNAKVHTVYTGLEHYQDTNSTYASFLYVMICTRFVTLEQVLHINFFTICLASKCVLIKHWHVSRFTVIMLAFMQ